MKIISFVFLVIFASSLHSTEIAAQEREVKIIIKRHYLLIDGLSYSDAEGVKLALEKYSNSSVAICTDADVPHKEVVAVIDELRSKPPANNALSPIVTI